MTIKKMGLVGSLWASLFFGGCPSPVDPPIDSPPAISSFSATPSVSDVHKPVLFSVSSSDKEGLDSVVVDFKDGSSKSFVSSKRTSSLDTVSHAYNAVGNYSPEAVAYASGKSATRGASVSVLANPPPFVADSLNGIEGLEKGVLKSAFVYSPQGRPVTLELISGNPSLIITQTSDSVKVRGANPDVNGNYNSTWKATDDKGNVTTKTVVSKIDARDDISGRVHDELEGTHVAGLYPELVMKGNLSGWAAMVSGKDSVRVPINSDGSFKFAKVVPGTHRVYRFATNGTDSSFVAYDDFSAGDRVVDAFVSTNAGTDNSVPGVVKPLPLKDLQDLYVAVNFRNMDQIGSGQGLLKGLDFSKKNTYYLPGKDLMIGTISFSGISPGAQDTLAGNLQQWIDLLPPALQQNLVIYKAPQGEAIPQTINQEGYPRPPPNMGWWFSKKSGSGSIVIYNKDQVILESAIMTYNPDINPIARNLTQLQEGGSWPCNMGGVFDLKLANKTIFHESNKSGFISHADKKLLWLTAQHAPGTIARQYWNLPN